MTRTKEDKKRLLELLRESPLITAACKRLGIGRATYYRWTADPTFKTKVEEAMREGRHRMADLAEAMLMKRVREGDMTAIKFLLTHNSQRYAPHHRVAERLLARLALDSQPTNVPPELKLTEEQARNIGRVFAGFKPEDNEHEKG